MLSETLTDGLNRYKIGQKIRNLRLDKKLALTELGAHTGLSTAMLSKIERGQPMRIRNSGGDASARKSSPQNSHTPETTS